MAGDRARGHGRIPADNDGPGSTEREFATVEAFVAWLAATYRRPVGHGAWWCPAWHLHPEAVHRLTALWDAYEALRLTALNGKALSMADWWLTYCDPTMRALMAPDGPFCECGGAHRDRLDPLPLTGGV